MASASAKAKRAISGLRRALACGIFGRGDVFRVCRAVSFGTVGAASSDTSGWLAFLGLHVPLAPDAAGYYSTKPLEKTLNELVDFSRLSSCAPRLTVGAANVSTSEMRYFDSRDPTLTARHVMGLRAAAFLTAGIAHVPFGRFLTADALAAIIGVPVGFGLAFFFTDQLEEIVAGAHRVERWAVVLLLVVAAAWIAVRAYQRSRVLEREARAGRHEAAR